jgi:hypothetical protein
MEKNIFDYTDDELEEINNDVNAQKDSVFVFKKLIDEMRDEISKVQHAMSQFQTNRLGIMTIAGVLSLFIFFSPDVEHIEEYFLIFVLPFLIVSILIHLFAFRTYAGTRRNFITAAPGNSKELFILSAEAKMIRDLWKMYYEVYHKHSIWHKWYLVFSKTFLILFFIYTYIFYYQVSFDYFTFLLLSINIFLLVITIGCIYLKNFSLSFKSGLKDN